MFTLFKSNRPSPRQRLYRWKGKAIVEIQISPKKQGRIHFKASSWRAETTQDITFLPGDVVEVKGIEDMILMVEAVTRE